MKTNCPILFKKSFFFTLAIGSILSLALFSRSVNAQDIIKMTAIPPRLEISADPGQAVAHQLKVRNEGDSQVALQVKIQDFIVTDSDGTPSPIDQDISNRWAASLWMNVSPQKIILNPGETKTLDLVAVVPQDANPGGHYAVVFYSPVDGADIGENTASSISPNVGSLIYFTVSGKVSEDARITKMTIPGFQEYGPIKIDTEILNLSDIHVRPQGVIRIYNMLGGLRTTIALEEKNIFPGVSRLFENTWNQKWGLGKYKATLEAGYGTQGGVLAASVFFWIIPWRIITIAILVIVLTALLVTYFKKGNKDQIIEKEPESSK